VRHEGPASSVDVGGLPFVRPAPRAKRAARNRPSFDRLPFSAAVAARVRRLVDLKVSGQDCASDCLQFLSRDDQRTCTTCWLLAEYVGAWKGQTHLSKLDFSIAELVKQKSSRNLRNHPFALLVRSMVHMDFDASGRLRRGTPRLAEELNLTATNARAATKLRERQFEATRVG
jgi:hypothetical protein